MDPFVEFLIAFIAALGLARALPVFFRKRYSEAAGLKSSNVPKAMVFFVTLFLVLWLLDVVI